MAAKEIRQGDAVDSKTTKLIVVQVPTKIVKTGGQVNFTYDNPQRLILTEREAWQDLGKLITVHSAALALYPCKKCAQRMLTLYKTSCWGLYGACKMTEINVTADVLHVMCRVDQTKIYKRMV